MPKTVTDVNELQKYIRGASRKLLMLGHGSFRIFSQV